MIKIILRLEKDGKYIEKRLSKKMICALFDLQYMIDDWSTIKLNKIDKDINKFFRIIEYFDNVMHGEKKKVKK